MLAALIIALAVLLPFIHCEFKETCPSKTIHPYCTQRNVCTSCDIEGDTQTSGCEYCNARRSDYCPWRCVQCDSDHEMWINWYGLTWCEPKEDTNIDVTTTTGIPAECTWEWARDYSNFASQDWIPGPSFTYEGVKECPPDSYDYDIEAKSIFSLVFSSVSVDGNSALLDGTWLCEGDSCDESSQFGQVSAFMNRYSANVNDGTIDLDVVQFRESGNVTIEGNNVFVEADSLKFGIFIEDITSPIEVCIDGWTSTWRRNQDNYTLCDEDDYQYTYYGDIADVIEVEDDSCLSIELANDKTIQVSISDDSKSVTLGEYQINNDETATCDGSDDMNVTVSTESKQIFVLGGGRYGGSRAFATVRMCYSFPACASGMIAYDPFVYYEGDDADSRFEVVSINISVLTIIVATLIMLHDAVC